MDFAFAGCDSNRTHGIIVDGSLSADSNEFRSETVRLAGIKKGKSLTIPSDRQGEGLYKKLLSRLFDAPGGKVEHGNKSQSSIKLA